MVYRRMQNYYACVFALCAVAASAVSLSNRGSEAKSIAATRLSAVRAAEQSVLRRKQRPARPNDEELEPPAQVQAEVEEMMNRVTHMDDPKLESEYVNQLEGVEASLAEHAGAAGSFAGEKLVAEIGSMRANLCVEQGFERHETEDCETFMKVVCSLEGAPAAPEGAAPQSPLAGNGPPVTHANCQQFFQEERREEETQADSQTDSQQAEVQQAEGQQAEAQTDGQQEQADEVEAAPAPAPAGAEDAGNATDNATSEDAGFFGGKKERPLPEQGYDEYVDGKLVEHNSVNTSTEDWLGERNGRDISTICREFPDNEWCQLHTYKPHRKKPALRYVPPPPPEEVTMEAAPEPQPEPKSRAVGSQGRAAFAILATVVVALVAA